MPPTAQLMTPLAAGLDIVYGQNVTLVDASSRQVVVTAIQTLGMGLLNKVVLRFPTAFWNQDAPTDWMDWIPQIPGATFEFYSLFR
ncbi:monoamine oxidase [Haematococcus lacustris]|uniref:Monoamine oxidase n=1 Tax=Haematococcus lacustris TaxID=44745 RepID=A0A699YRI8_HAELA|nr:monoamine oxidase [Haematococcus lacustris]